MPRRDHEPSRVPPPSPGILFHAVDHLPSELPREALFRLNHRSIGGGSVELRPKRAESEAILFQTDRKTPAKCLNTSSRISSDHPTSSHLHIHRIFVVNPGQSSEHFGDCLVPFLPSLASQLASRARVLRRSVRTALRSEDGLFLWLLTFVRAMGFSFSFSNLGN